MRKRNFIILLLVILPLLIYAKDDYFTMEKNGDTYLCFEVTILGEVNHPGNYVLKDGDRLSYAISQAGGGTSSADMGNILVIRDGKIIKTSILKYIKDGNVSFDIELKPGDVIVVKRSLWSYFSKTLDIVYKTVLIVNSVILMYYYYSNITK